MLGRVRELYYEYCVPKPKRFFTLWDTEVSNPPAHDSPEGLEERESIDFYIHLLV